MAMTMAPGPALACSTASALICFRRARLRSGFGDLDFRAVAQPIDAVNDDLVARRESGSDRREFSVGRSGDDIALRHRRIVVEDIDKVARGPDLDGRVRRQ